MITTSTPTAEVTKPVAQAFKKILVAVRNDRAASVSIAMAARLSTRGVTHVRLLHLQERSTDTSRRSGMAIEIETYEQAVDFAAKMQAEIRELGVEAQLQVGREVTGREAQQVLEAADDFGADLIIAGNRQKSALDRFLRGSTTRDIVRKCATSLLLVPEIN